MPLPPPLQARIQKLIQQDKVVLFMKGTRQQPRCGFSASVVEILDELVPAYATVDVLADPEVREGIKEFSDWPTIPQLFIAGEFIGGADITKEMHASGELRSKLGAPQAPAAAKALQITLTDDAVRALKRAAQGEDAAHDHLRISINGRFQHKMSFGPQLEGDTVVEVNGLKVAVDKASVKRADGLKIGFVDGKGGGGFQIDNPNEPAAVRALSVQELKKRLDDGQALELFDVRGDGERAIARIAQAKQLDEAQRQRLAGLDKSTPLYFHCHHGGRSQAAAEQALQQGFRTVYNVVGGIDAWSQEVDPSVPRY